MSDYVGCDIENPLNCVLLDTSMKFGTLIVVTNKSIFRYSAKPEIRQFP